MVIILIGLFLGLSIVIEGFFSIRNIFSILEQVSMFGVISIGVTLVIITAGIDLSSGSVVALAGVVVASIVGDMEGTTYTLGALGAALAVGAFCGLINGGLTAITSIPPFIATLGMMTIARGGAQLYSGGRPIDASADTFTFIADGHFLGIPGLVWIYIIVVIFSHILLSKTKFGRHIYAIGGNMNASRICGINVEKVLILVYTFAGALAGLAGAMLTARTYAGNPSYGLAWELDAIAATVIGGTSLAGGRGTVIMCVVGALIIGTINKGLNLLGIDPYWQQIIKGVIIIGAVILDMLKHKKT